MKNTKETQKPCKFDECYRCGKNFTPGIKYKVAMSHITGNNIFLCKECADKQDPV